VNPVLSFSLNSDRVDFAPEFIFSKRETWRAKYEIGQVRRGKSTIDDGATGREYA